MVSTNNIKRNLWNFFFKMIDSIHTVKRNAQSGLKYPLVLESKVLSETVVLS